MSQTIKEEVLGHFLMISSQTYGVLLVSLLHTTQVYILWGLSKLMGESSRNGASVSAQMLSLPKLGKSLLVNCSTVMESQQPTSC